MAHHPTLQDRIAMETVQTPPQQPPPGQPQQPQQPPPAAPQQPPAPGQAPTPPGPVQPTAPGPAPNAQTYVQVSSEEYRALLADRQMAEQARKAEEQRAAKAEADRLRAIADKDGVEAALRLANEQRQTKEAEYQQEVARYRARLLDFHKGTELSKVLVGADWVSPAAGRDALAKVAAQFEAVDAGGQVLVRQVGTGKPPAEAIPELLRTDEFSHYLRAGTQGGAGAGGTHSTPGAGGAPAGYVVPQTEGEKAYAEYLARVEAQKAAGYSPALGLTFGPNAPQASGAPAPGQPLRPIFQH